MNTPKKNLVVSNQLVKGRYTLTKEEQNFIYLMISQINKTDTKFTEYQIHIKDLESSELTQKQYGRYKDFAKKLRSREIVIEDDKRILVAGWFADIEYIKNTGVIKATISEKLKPYLLQLKEEFVQAKLPTLLQFNSKYSSRLYLSLKSDLDRVIKHKHNLYVIYDIDDLRTKFELPKSYIQYSNFKDKFLINSMDEINEKTDLKVSYEEKKTGRKITSIEFCISYKKSEDISLESLKNKMLKTKTRDDYIPAEVQDYTRIVLLDEALNLTAKDIQHIYKNYEISDIEDVCFDIEPTLRSKKIKSHIAVFRAKLTEADNNNYHKQMRKKYNETT